MVFLFVLALKKKLNMEQALINTVIAFKLMQYSYSLKCFFKDEYKKNGIYMIPISHIFYIKRKIFPLIIDSCGDVFCHREKECDGHQFLKFIDKLCNFIEYAVLEKKCYYRYFSFYNFRLRSHERYSMDNQIEKVAGWNFYPLKAKNLSHLSYSQRLSYLN